MRLTSLSLSLPARSADPAPAGLGRRTASLLTALTMAAAALLGGSALTAGGAHASSTDDYFIGKINEERAAAGVRALTPRADLAAVAQSWAGTMAAQAKLYHNPDLTSDVDNWSTVGENVGYGPDALTVHVAFMGSPGHRANILDTDYTEVGVGTVVADGRVWVAEVFRRPQSAPTGGSTAPSPAATGTAFPGELRSGSTGAAVRKVQARLGVQRSGFYGTRTKRSVTRFQRSHGLRATGVVGRRTWNRLF